MIPSTATENVWLGTKKLQNDPAVAAQVKTDVPFKKNCKHITVYFNMSCCYDVY